MTGASLLFLLSPLLQAEDDPDSLCRRLEHAALSREDDALFKDIEERASRCREALSRRKDDAARVLLELAGPGTLETPWTPDDPGLRASLAWIAGRKGGNRWIDELAKRLWDPDPRTGFAAARALHRLLDEKAFGEFRGRYFRRGFGPWEPGREILPGYWLETARGAPTHYLFQLWSSGLGSDESLILFLHLLPEDGFRSFVAQDMGFHPYNPAARYPFLMRRLREAADRFDTLPEYARDRLVDVVIRLGGPDAIFPFVLVPSRDLRERVQRALGRLGTEGELWFLRWVELLEKDALDPDLASWAHQVLRPWAAPDAGFTDRAASARLFREHFRRNSRTLMTRYLDRGIDRGAEFLKKAASRKFDSGVAPFPLFVLLRAGVPVDDPVIQKGFQALPRNGGFHDGMTILACAQYCIRSSGYRGRAIVPRGQVLDRLRESVQKLEGQQKENGWVCAPNAAATPAVEACHPCTQLAVLALAEASEAGIRVRPSVWDRAANSLLRIQGSHGCSCMIADALALQLALKAARPKDSEKCLQEKMKILEWVKADLGRDASLERALLPAEGSLGRESLWGYGGSWHHSGGPGGNVYGWHWHDGYGNSISALSRGCGLQRLGLLSGPDRPPDSDGLAEGALLVLMHQTPSGAWLEGGSGIISTGAALLFLRGAHAIPSVDPRNSRAKPDSRPRPPDKYEKAAGGIRLPDAKALKSWADRSEHHRRVIEVLSDPRNWSWSLQAIDDRLGLFFPDCEVEVVLEETPERRPSQGGGRDGKGVVKFNVRRLVEYLREVEQARKKQSETSVWVVPPMSLEALMTHELAHVFTGPCEEKWLAEGLASYAAGDTSFLFAFNYRRAAVKGLSEPVSEEDGYARGWAFLEWVRAKEGPEKVRQFAAFVRNEGAALAEAAPAVTGKTWDETVREEEDWSREFLSRYKPSR